MPGITNRTALFAKLPNGTMRRMDFNLVNTDLGAMVEPCQSIPGFGVGAGTLGITGDTPTDDLSTNAFNDIKIGREDEFYAGLSDGGMLLHGGFQTPRLY